MYIVKFQGKLVGSTKLEKGDPPMGVALGNFTPSCAIENTLGTPLNSDVDIKGWEGCDVYTSSGEKLNCSSVYLEQFDFGSEGRVYQITCFVTNGAEYKEHFQHHITDYENSF